MKPELVLVVWNQIIKVTVVINLRSKAVVYCGCKIFLFGKIIPPINNREHSNL